MVATVYNPLEKIRELTEARSVVQKKDIVEASAVLQTLRSHESEIEVLKGRIEELEKTVNALITRRSEK